MAKVSIILPTYNRAHSIKRSIDSVLLQSYTDFELIIVDDNSRDNTQEVIKGCADSRIRVVKNEVNLGPSGARNKGMECASGEYIAFQDSDDEWMPDKLKIMMQVFADESPGMVFSSVYQQLIDGTRTKYPTGSRRISSERLYETILYNNIVATPAAIMTRECFKGTGFFDTGMKCFEDYDYFIRVAEKYKVVHIPEPLLIQHQSPGGVNTPNYGIRADMLQLIINKHMLELEKYPYALAERFFRLGDFFCLDGNRSEGIKMMFRAIKLKGISIQYLLGLVIALISYDVNIYRYIRQYIDQLRTSLKSR